MKMLELNITARCPCMTLKMQQWKNIHGQYKMISLSDNIHGPYKMMPPELLHTSGRLIMYMFESLRDQMGGGKYRDLID